MDLVADLMTPDLDNPIYLLVLGSRYNLAGPDGNLPKSMVTLIEHLKKTPTGFGSPPTRRQLKVRHRHMIQVFIQVTHQVRPRPHQELPRRLPGGGEGDDVEDQVIHQVTHQAIRQAAHEVTHLTNQMIQNILYQVCHHGEVGGPTSGGPTSS